MMNIKYFWDSWYHYPKKMGNFKLEYPHWVTEETAIILSGKNIDDQRLTICAAIPSRDFPYSGLNDPTRIIYKSYDVRPDRIHWIHKEIKEGSPFNEKFVRSDWMKWPF